MGLFSFMRRNSPVNGHAVHAGAAAPARPAPEVPENLFIEKEPAPAAEEKPAAPPPPEEHTIDLLFRLLDRNYEAKGYDDALANPDASHMAQHVESIRNELERTIRKVKTYYQTFISEIDFHIASRSRSGLIDTVDELQMKRDIAQGHISKVLEIEEEARNDKGQGLILSYTRGFKNGLAAISHHSILKRKL